MFPPTTNRFHRKLGGIVVHANFGGNREKGTGKRMLNLPVPLSLLLGVDRNHRIFQFQKLFRLFVDEFKPSVSVRIVSAFHRLAVPRKMVFHFVQQLADLRFGNIEFRFLQHFRQTSGTVCRPSQGRHGIAFGGWFNDGVECGKQTRLFFCYFFSSSSFTSNTVSCESLVFFEFLDALADYWSGKPRCTDDDGKSGVSQTYRFRCRPKTTLAFIPCSRQRLILSCDDFFREIPP